MNGRNWNEWVCLPQLWIEKFHRTEFPSIREKVWMWSLKSKTLSSRFGALVAEATWYEVSPVSRNSPSFCFLQSFNNEDVPLLISTKSAADVKDLRLLENRHSMQTFRVFHRAKLPSNNGRRLLGWLKLVPDLVFKILTLCTRQLW